MINLAVAHSKTKIMEQGQKELNINFNISASSPFTIFKKLIKNCEKKKIICKYINIGSVLNEKVSPDQSVGYHIAKMSAFSIFKIFSVYYRSSLFSATSIKIGYLSSREKLKGKNKKKFNLIKEKYKKLSNNSLEVTYDDIIYKLKIIIGDNSNISNGDEISIDSGISNLENFYVSRI